MNLSIQNINTSTNYTLIQSPKITFKGNFLKSDLVEIEQKVIEKIKTMPRNTYEEQLTFLNFCIRVNITPKISKAISERLEKNKQAKVSTDKTFMSLTEISKRIIEGYKWFLDNGRELSKHEIAEIKGIMSDPKISQDVKNKAMGLLRRIYI